MKKVKKYRLLVLGFFILCCSTMAVVQAQPQQEMSSTSPMLQQFDNSSFATRNTEAVMYSGSTYSANVEEPSSSAPSANGPRRVNGHPDIPMPDPLGDALLPLALLALGYFGYRVIRRKREA